MEEINKLNFSIDEFKNNYWYSKNIDIPQFVKNIEPNITEEQFFNKLLLNVFNTCDLFINQKMSQFLVLDITLGQIKDILGEQRVKNFISSVYTEIKYRIASEKFPEFSQRDKLITSNFSLASTGREFNNFQGLLSPEAIAYLTSPSWIDLKFKKDDYFNIVSIIEKLNSFDNRIEKLLKDNSELDENLKTSFLAFKSNQETKNINLQEEINKKQNLIENKLLSFLNNNVLNENELGDNDGEYLNINFGDSDDDIGITLNTEYYKVFIEPGGILVKSENESNSTFLNSSSLEFRDGENKTISELTAENLSSLLNNLDKTKSLEDKFNSFDNRIEKLLKDNSELDENLKTSFLAFKSNQEIENNKTNSRLDANNEKISSLTNEWNLIKTSIDAVKASKEEFDKLKTKDKLIIELINKLIIWNSAKLNLDFIKSNYVEDISNEYQPSKYKPGDVIEFNNKKIILISSEQRRRKDIGSSGAEMGVKEYYYEWKYYELD